jgi:hypothetical protein
MFLFRRQYPFSNVSLKIQSDASVGLIRDELAFPTLPEGMRVDDCWILEFGVDCGADQSLMLELEIDPTADWSGGFATGEWLDAVELESADGDCAAVGMRDPDWLSAQFDLELIKANHRDRPPLLFSATYRTRRAASMTIQLACAVSRSTKSDQEAVSPWFAVDLAMSH